MPIKRLPKLSISEKEMKYIFGEEYQDFVDKLIPNCSCHICNDSYNSTIVNYASELDYLNDIILHGKCAKCEGPIVRCLETGETPALYKRAMIVRKRRILKKGVDYIGVSAGAMIINDKGELFLSKRSQKATNERGCWETPGGSVELGETLRQAVEREMWEEYGIHIQIIKQFPAENHIIPTEKQHWVASTFLAITKNGEEPRIMEPDKCEAIGWFSLDQLPKPLSIITKLDIKHHGKEIVKN